MAIPRKRQFVFVVNDGRPDDELVRNWMDRTACSLGGGNTDVAGYRRVRPRYSSPRCIYGFTGDGSFRDG